MSAELDRDLPLVGITPTPAEKADFRYFRGESSLGADFAYSLVLPKSWTYHPPTGRVDLDEGPASLGVFSEYPGMMPPTLLSVGALRANTAVSLQTFYAAYCHVAELTPLLIYPRELDGFLGVDGLIDTPDGLRMRLLMTEDGGRVLVLAGVATRDDYPDRAKLLATIMVSCEFVVTRGPTMGITDE